MKPEMNPLAVPGTPAATATACVAAPEGSLEWLLQTKRLEQVSAEVNTALPNVLILGDSISIGYTPGVRQLLAGAANVSRPDCNCGPSQFYLKHMESWVGTGKWDVIHVNFGIWDNHYLTGPSDGMDLFWEKETWVKELPDTPIARGRAIREHGYRIRTPLPEYEQNLRTILTFLQTHADKVVFGLTTPVSGWERDDRCGRIPVYNEAATAICAELGVGVTDLHRVVEMNLDEQTDGCHFSDAGYKLLADAVAASITKCLASNGSVSGVGERGARQGGRQ